MSDQDEPRLDRTVVDELALAARSVAGACPFIGTLLAEIFSRSIPNQRLDRTVTMLKMLDQRVGAIERGVEKFSHSVNTQEGLDLIEEGVIQASRALSGRRRGHLANLLSRSLTAEELKYAESKKMLNLLRELTDPELIMLSWYSKPMAFGSQWHREMQRRHSEVLAPASREMGVGQEEQDRAALQESYRNTLGRLGLVVRASETNCELTSMGNLFLSYIGIEDV